MTAIPEKPSGVVVTLREIYDAVVRTERKVDDVATSTTALTDDSKDHEARIRAMEVQIWKWAGGAAALGIGGGFGLSKLLGG